MSLNDAINDFSRVNLLVNFVDYLEKIIYNAYEGTVNSFADISKVTKAFFRTNKQTCNDWFCRIRFNMINVSIRSGNYETAVRHSYEYLNYFVMHNFQLNQDFEAVLINLVRALVKLESWQSLEGLYKYLSQTFKKHNFEWIKSAIEEAKGSLELASDLYKKEFRGYILSKSSSQSTRLAKYECDRVFDCYFRLHDWESYMEWHSEYKSIYDKLDNENLRQQFDMTKYELNYVK